MAVAIDSLRFPLFERVVVGELDDFFVLILVPVDKVITVVQDGEQYHHFAHSLLVKRVFAEVIFVKRDDD